ncbi:hypothetical protein [Azospirillum sp. B2RO_4]|uniref:hypothetical protein n=1 Tax=Azospirillum sp. B2RO_4 TaxID=3027796 RepID=UPI003DA81707
MRTDFSEFSFGYALTEEFMYALRPTVRAAPVFPSLIEEGQDDGGYDVAFDSPGLPVKIQFKRPDVMLTRRSKEIADHGIGLATPFYRMHIRSSAISKQHDLLLGHDNGSSEVYYASPCFHQTADFDRYYVTRTVIDNTLFIRPRDIGVLTAEPHHVAYDNTALGWRFSDEPVKIERIKKGRSVSDDFIKGLDKDNRPLGEGPLNEAVADLENMLRKNGVNPQPLRPEAVARLRGPRKELYRLAELTRIHLNAQLFIVQRDDL